MNNEKSVINTTIGNFIIVSGPSGVGKTSIVNEVSNNRLITTTTRHPREGEVHGVDYNFISSEEFEQLIKEDLLIEWSKYGPERNAKYYGLTKSELDKKIKQGNVFAIVDVQGKRRYKELFPNSISIYIYSTYETVKQQLIDRGELPSTVSERISMYEEEVTVKREYDFCIKNNYGDFLNTVESFKNIINH